MTDTAPPPANRFVEDARRSYIERTRPPERDSTPGGEVAECLPGDDSVADANARSLPLMDEVVVVPRASEPHQLTSPSSLPVLRSIKKKRDRERWALNMLMRVAALWLPLASLFRKKAEVGGVMHKHTWVGRICSGCGGRCK